MLGATSFPTWSELLMVAGKVSVLCTLVRPCRYRP